MWPLPISESETWETQRNQEKASMSCPSDMEAVRLKITKVYLLLIFFDAFWGQIVRTLCWRLSIVE